MDLAATRNTTLLVSGLRKSTAIRPEKLPKLPLVRGQPMPSTMNWMLVRLGSIGVAAGPALSGEAARRAANARADENKHETIGARRAARIMAPLSAIMNAGGATGRRLAVNSRSDEIIRFRQSGADGPAPLLCGDEAFHRRDARRVREHRLAE